MRTRDHNVDVIATVAAAAAAFCQRVYMPLDAAHSDVELTPVSNELWIILSLEINRLMNPAVFKAHRNAWQYPA